jgi:hypothetical protein
MTYEASRSGPQTWNIALNREHWREQGKEKPMCSYQIEPFAPCSCSGLTGSGRGSSEPSKLPRNLGRKPFPMALGDN